jgi:excinuclease ABC subunit C
MIDVSLLPKCPGCYIFKDKNQIIIYVGKAKELRRRVSSYFNRVSKDPKTNALVSQIDSFDFFATKNEVEALVLENNLIKKHSPKYNINLKDSKRYAYLEITGEEFPRLVLARGNIPTTKKGRLFGPFVSGTARVEISEFLTRTFRLRTCRKMPARPCLRQHLKLCDAPCSGIVTKEAYNESIKRVESILSGKTRELIKELQSEMETAARQKSYESAIYIRNLINSLKWLDEKQNMERNAEYDEDIINYCQKESRVYLMMFSVKHGILERKQDFSFPITEDFLDEFLLQYYAENKIPKELILPVPVDDALKDFLSKMKGSNVSITVPRKGSKRELLMLAEKNIELVFFADEKRLTELKQLLKLESLPTVIECFDISHLSGTSTVASMVQFRSGKPNKENYRRFRIRTVSGIDDFAAIAEVVGRRYSRLKLENAALPGLIVVDGGIGQLNAATAKLMELGLKIPIISIAKEFEDIYVPGLHIPLPVDKKSSALMLICSIRDEAHRFAISYNRLLRKKSLFEKNGDKEI